MCGNSAASALLTRLTFASTIISDFTIMSDVLASFSFSLICFRSSHYLSDDEQSVTTVRFI
jgi:hypothetical protein